MLTHLFRLKKCPICRARTNGPGQVDLEEIAPGQINFKEMGPDQMGFGQMSPTKINSSRNEFLRTIFKIALSHLISN